MNTDNNELIDRVLVACHEYMNEWLPSWMGDAALLGVNSGCRKAKSDDRVDIHILRYIKKTYKHMECTFASMYGYLSNRDRCRS